jgi:hypothetical protein
MLNTTVENNEETKRRYNQCTPISKKQTSLEHPPLEKLHTVLSVWFKQARESNASTEATDIREKVLQIATHLGVANCSASNRWIDKFKRRQNTVYRIV